MLNSTLKRKVFGTGIAVAVLVARHERPSLVAFGLPMFRTPR